MYSQLFLVYGIEIEMSIYFKPSFRYFYSFSVNYSKCLTFLPILSKLLEIDKCSNGKEDKGVEQKEMYTLEELYDSLEIALSELGRRGNLSEVTVARIRDGYSARRSTINKLLRAFSETYGIKLSLNNVTGIHLQNKKATKKQIPDITEREDLIPANLPPGSLMAAHFAEAHNIPPSSFNRWINEGLKGDHFETENIPRVSGKGSFRYLTPTQQEGALDLLRRHEKLKPAEPNEEYTTTNNSPEE